MEGVPVVGGRDDIFLNVDKYHINQILLAKRAYCATLKARIIYSQYGPADFQEGKTHHNWYLFEDKIDSAKMIK